MVDNVDIADATNTPVAAAADELSDSSKSPKVTLLAGDSSPTPYRIDQALGALTEAAPASDTASSGLNGRLQRIAQRITSFIALLPASLGTKASSASLAVTLASDEAVFPSQGATSSGQRGPMAQGVAATNAPSYTAGQVNPQSLTVYGSLRVQANRFIRLFQQVTRPSDTTAYTIGDAIGPTGGGAALIEFTGAAIFGGGQGRVRGALLTKSTTGATGADFRLHLFQGSPGWTAPADNAAYSWGVNADRALIMGYVDFSASQLGAAPAGDGMYFIGSINGGHGEMMFDCSSTGTSIYGVLEARGAYAPGSAEIFSVTLDVEQGK